MIAAIIAWSARNRWLVAALTAAAVVAAIFSLKTLPLDAIPDIADRQVIVTTRWDRSPDLVDKRITAPLVRALSGVPGVRTVRGLSDFGFSYVYVILEDGASVERARAQVAAAINANPDAWPAGAAPRLGPDASSVGWVYQYALVDDTHKLDLSDLRFWQDTVIKPHVGALRGVAEVASIGGYKKQYQLQLDPAKMMAHGVSLPAVVEALKTNNSDFGAGLIELSGAEYMIRGRGSVRSIEDIESIAVPVGHRAAGSMSGGHDGSGYGSSDAGSEKSSSASVLIRQLGRVAAVPESRRGVSDLDGLGEAVGGIVVMKQGENALAVIAAVKEKLEELRPSLPRGVQVVETYDRSALIWSAIHTLTQELLWQMLLVVIVIFVFLRHVPSAIVPIVTMPVVVVLSFLPMALAGFTVNIMSLAGIAISIGVLVDGAIIEVENAYKRMEEWNAQGRSGDPSAVRLKALQEVGPSVFFSLLVVAVAFLPIFALTGQEGRLFKPLAFSKNGTMVIAALLAVTFDPAVRLMFTSARTYRFQPEEKHPLSRFLFRWYEPACRYVLKKPREVILAALGLVVVTLPVYFLLGREDRPPLYEGSLLYMPTTFPSLSITEAGRLLRAQDAALKQIPEVDRVFGKAGRADTATDPAPLSMMETTILLKPASQWRRGLTKEKLVNELDQAVKTPGVSNAWTMPIKARIDMLSTGIHTPVGLKIIGPDPREIEKIGIHLEEDLKSLPGTRSVLAERAQGGYFLDFDIKRDELANYGLTVADVEMTMMTLIGGEPVTSTLEGTQRISIGVRVGRELRATIDDLKRIPLHAPDGALVPLGHLASVSIKTGPAMIRNENGLACGYVFIDVAGRDIGGYVEDAKDFLQHGDVLPPGYTVVWAGQYENALHVRRTLLWLVPLTLLLIGILLYANTRSLLRTGIVLLAVPFSMIGAIWLLWLLGYNVSIAVWVGLIALMGLDAETGVFMLLYLDLATKRAKADGRLNSGEDLKDALIEGAVKRLRPKFMTVATTMIALLPVLWASGLGADTLKRIAAPMLGGLATSFLLELLIYPPVYYLCFKKLQNAL